MQEWLKQQPEEAEEVAALGDLADKQHQQIANASKLRQQSKHQLRRSRQQILVGTYRR